MSKYKFDGDVHVANIGSGSTSVVGAIGKDANGTVITDNADGDVIGAIGERANGTVIIED